MELRPFRSIRYSRATIAEQGLSELIAPPGGSDSRAPGNISRVVSAATPEDAAATLKRWLGAGILEKERRPTLWMYRQTFSLDGRPLVRDALVGLVRLATPREQGAILDPNAPPEPDRLERALALRRGLRADFTPSFLLTRAPLTGHLATTRRPELSAVDADGVRHDAFRIVDYAAHVELQGSVKNAEAILADGEDVFEAAVAYSGDPDAAKLSGAKYKLCAIVDVESPGLIVRAVHRLVSGIADWDPGRVLYAASDFFERRDFATWQDASAALEDVSRLSPAFVVVAPPEKPAVLVLRERPDALPWPSERSDAWRGLDAAALEVAFFSRLLSLDALGEQVRATSDAAAAVAAVEKGEAQAAILMRPLTISEIETVVHAGDRLPRGSANFYPEMFAGLFGVSLEDPVY